MSWTETPAEIFRRNCQEKADKIFREKLIADAKNQIHNEDVAKKKHIVNEIAGRNSRMV